MRFVRSHIYVETKMINLLRNMKYCVITLIILYVVIFFLYEPDKKICVIFNEEVLDVL